MFNELVRTLPDLSDEELIRITTTDRSGYMPEALALVEAEIARRRVRDATDGQCSNAVRQVPPENAEPRPRSLWLTWVNPTLRTEGAALRAARQGAIAAWLVSAVAGIASVLAVGVEAFADVGLGMWLFNAVIFLCIGFGIWRGSLAFATIGFVLYLVLQVGQSAMSRHFPSIWVILLLVAFLNGFRGAKALRGFRRTLQVASGGQHE